MSKIIDARGFSCPQPVLMTLDEIRSGEVTELEVLVDTDTSKENVSRAAVSQGWTIIKVREEGDGYAVVIKKD
ncbi:MAG TPA: preprotein translocase subunit TatB [Deltaproteobacteria bacterium]|nr:preprotein translocase subunit TatB [Deltaproteobacteria bacterium]